MRTPKPPPRPPRGETSLTAPIGTVTASQCHYCRHRARGHLAVCKAFPSAIPQAILDNKADHRDPIAGDQGVTFEPRGDVGQTTLTGLYRILDAIA